MDFSALMSMFAPQMGQDPFATANALATQPDQMVNQLAQLGPPPPPGQPFGDFFKQKIDEGALPANARPTSFTPPDSGIANAMPKAPTPGATTLTGPFNANPVAPSPLLGPSSPAMGAGESGYDVPGVGYVPGQLPLPGMPKAGGLIPPGYTGAEPVPGVGPVPTTGGVGSTMPPDLQSGPTPLSAITTSPGGGKKPEILSRGGDERSVPQGGEAAPTPMDPKKAAAIQAAMKNMGGMLAGLKAPPAPETQKIASPSAPRSNPGQTGGLAALIAQLAGTAPPAVPLRLGNALYAGGRGLY